MKTKSSPNRLASLTSNTLWMVVAIALAIIAVPMILSGLPALFITGFVIIGVIAAITLVGQRASEG